MLEIASVRKVAGKAGRDVSLSSLGVASYQYCLCGWFCLQPYPFLQLPELFILLFAHLFLHHISRITDILSCAAILALSLQLGIFDDFDELVDLFVFILSDGQLHIQRIHAVVLLKFC
jgi:hypothetical protein